MTGLLQWAMLMVFVILIILAATAGPTQEAIAEAIRTSARLYSREIAGIINLLQAAPDGTTYRYVLPPLDCTVRISSDVKVVVKSKEQENYFASDLIRTTVEIEPAIIPCSKDTSRLLRFEKQNNKISVSGVAASTPSSPTPSPAPTPSPTDTSYDINVLVIKYFPLTTDGKNIDIAVTGDVGDSYTVIRQRTIDVTNTLMASLEKASTYLGYKNPAAQPALRYHIIDTKEYTQSFPLKQGTVDVPDYQNVLRDHDICNYVENQNVKEVWLWAYHGKLAIFEWEVVGPPVNTAAPYDMPVCRQTYNAYTFNYQHGTQEAIESWGHGLEYKLRLIDTNLFQRFQGPPYPACNPDSPIDYSGDGKIDSTDSQICRSKRGNGVGRCGSVHNPPNALHEYNRNNPTPQQSDCLDWNPDSLGALSSISCSNWGCQHNGDTDNPVLNYQIWNWQNLPGRGNQKTYQGTQLRNWWDVHGDFDNVMANSRRLTIA